ncbi:MAG: hypothetical protein A2X78_00790 [Gammaproteobacteria bacterium GWE2_37_16]|nr:MAG: hypothetical protein A2X78_00790 [Gammaproteobacteria bacterium GWE2_37_16]
MILQETLSKNGFYSQKHWVFLDSKVSKKICTPTAHKLKRYYLGDQYPNIYFTRREMECMEGFFRGRRIKQIARDLNVSPRTVEEHFENMREKLHCRNNRKLADLVVYSNFIASVDFKYRNYEDREQSLVKNCNTPRC